MTGDESVLDLRVYKFLKEFAFELAKHDPQNLRLELFDLPASLMLTNVLATAYKNKNTALGFAAKIGLTEFINRMSKMVGTMPVRVRLKLFAHFGWVVVDTESWIESKKNEGKWVRDTQIITPNDAFLSIFDEHCSGLRKQFIRTSIGWGTRRLEYSQFPSKTFQGFKAFTVPYGLAETVENRYEDLVGGDYLIDRIEKKKTDDEERKALNKRWFVLGEKFIKAAADIWTVCQCAAGAGPGRPPWEAKSSTLAAPIRRERGILIKMFEQYGGAVTGLAWTAFCAGSPEIGENGKRTWNLDIPHRNRVSPDKRPSDFATNILTVIRDADFKEMSRGSWPESKTLLLEYFGDLIDVEPKDGRHYSSLIGYALGDCNPLPGN